MTNLLIKPGPSLSSVGDIQKSVPKKYRYNDFFRAFPEGRKEKLEIFPNNSSTYTRNNRIVRIDLPNDGLLDMRDSYLLFDALPSATSPTAAVNQIVTLVALRNDTNAVSSPTTGSYRLGFKGHYTDFIAFDAAVATIAAAINALETIQFEDPNDSVKTTGRAATGSVSVVGALDAGNTVITFDGGWLSGRSLPNIDAGGGNMTNGTQGVSVSIDITTVGVQNNLSFSNGIYTILSQIELRVGNQIVHQIQNAGLLYSILRKVKSDDGYHKNAGRLLFGEGDRNERIALNSGTVRYAIKMSLLLDLFKHKILPVELLPELRIEIQLADPSNCIECDGTLPDYAISDVRLICDQIFPESSYMDILRQELNQVGELAFIFHDWKNQRDTFNSTSLNTNLNTASKFSMVNFLLGVFRTQSTLSTTTTLDKFDIFNLANATQFQANLNGRLIPPKKVTSDAGGTEAFIQLMKIFERDLGVDSHEVPSEIVDHRRYNVDRFIFGIDLKTHDMGSDNDILSGHNLARTTSRLAFQLDASSAPALQQIDYYINYTGALILKPNKSVQLLV